MSSPPLPKSPFLPQGRRSVRPWRVDSDRLALAVDVPAGKPVEEHMNRTRGAGSRTRKPGPTSGERGGQPSGHHQARRPHTFRHWFATPLLDVGYDIRTIQELPGHKDGRTTMIHTHVLSRGVQRVRSPLDPL